MLGEAALALAPQDTLPLPFPSLSPGAGLWPAPPCLLPELTAAPHSSFAHPTPVSQELPNNSPAWVPLLPHPATPIHPCCLLPTQLALAEPLQGLLWATPSPPRGPGGTPGFAPLCRRLVRRLPALRFTRAHRQPRGFAGASPEGCPLLTRGSGRGALTPSLGCAAASLSSLTDPHVAPAAAVRGRTAQGGLRAGDGAMVAMAS